VFSGTLNPTHSLTVGKITLKVIQAHWKWAICYVSLLISASILHHFQDVPILAILCYVQWLK